MAHRTIHILRAGRISYAQGLNLQQYIAKQSTGNDGAHFKNVLVLTEHQPVYTIGIRTKDYTQADEQRLQSLGAEFYRANRGGLITFHGPGQLVAYPIINLNHFKPSMRWYVCHLEKSIIDLCAQLGLQANTSPHTGVWIGNNKICAMGVHGSRYITTHGLALNCNTDLKWFEHIVPCGIAGKGVTSLSKELNSDISPDDAVPLLLDSLKKMFECNLIECSDDETKHYLEKL